MTGTTRLVQEVTARGWTYAKFDFAFRQAAKQMGDPHANGVHVTHRMYRRWLAGEVRTTQRQVLVILSHMFGVPPDEVFAPIDSDGVLGPGIFLDATTEHVVNEWLREAPGGRARDRRRAVLVSFLAWLQEAHPGLGLLAATGAHVEEWHQAALAGELSTSRFPGQPLTPALAARRRSALLSFYAAAWYSGALDARARARAYRITPSLTRGERRRLRQGAEKLAQAGRLTEALLVMLLETTDASTKALMEITTRNLYDSHITVRDGEHGDLVALRVPSYARPWLQRVRDRSEDGKPLISRQDGCPVTRAWLVSAFIDAAISGGIPEGRVQQLARDRLSHLDMLDQDFDGADCVKELRV